MSENKMPSLLRNAILKKVIAINTGSLKPWTVTEITKLISMAKKGNYSEDLANCLKEGGGLNIKLSRQEEDDFRRCFPEK